MYVMTENGWRLLSPKCHNAVWELSVWDEKAKELVRDTGPIATLNFMGVTDHIKEAPPMYRGELPSKECLRYIAKLDRDHEEWLERRASMIS